MATYHYRNVDANAADTIKTGWTRLEWMHVINETATKCYVHLYDGTAASGTPDLTFAVPTTGDTNGAGFNLPLGGRGQEFQNGLTLTCTTNSDGSAGDPEGVLITAGYE